MGEQVPEFSRRDVAVAVLVEVPQPLDEVVGGVGSALPGDGVQDGQEHLEADAVLWKKMNIAN